MSAPVAMLSSGQAIILREIMLFDEAAVMDVIQLRAFAATALGPRGFELGMIGSPNWSSATEAAAMQVVSSVLVGSAQRAAVRHLESARQKFEALTRAGIYVPFAAVQNGGKPHPHAWRAEVDGRVKIHNGDQFVIVKSNLGEMHIRWAEVVAFMVTSSPDE